MSLNFRFAIVSDLHVALPHTILDHPSRFHLVEVSIPALEQVLDHLAQIDLDFLLLPGDLTQHGEPANHQWLTTRLAQLPYPVYVVPGNHDVVERWSTEQSIGLTEFPAYYPKFGYATPGQPYYSCQILPGVRLIGLNSNAFDDHGQQLAMGRLDRAQLQWLEQTLETVEDDLVLVMIHHNVIEHLPGQRRNPLGRRYMLSNAAVLLRLLGRAGVKLIFTGHLHVQDIARQHGIYDITTGSLVSYPHPYRILEVRQDALGRQWLQVESSRVESVPGWPNLQATSREWMGDRSFPFMMKLLTAPPLSLPLADAEAIAPALRYFWADVAQGDPLPHFPHLPSPVRAYFERFSTFHPAHGVDLGAALIDNHATLLL